MGKLNMPKCKLCGRLMEKNLPNPVAIKNIMTGKKDYFCDPEQMCIFFAKNGLSCNICTDKELIEKNMF
ncbi:MAG: hypothetical protein AABY22_10905 [Nanoarchaeota archaeon]